MARKQQWSVGHLFIVQLKDGQYVLGQVVSQEPAVLNSARVAFFDLRTSPEEAATAPTTAPDIFAVLFTTRDLLDSGVWRGARDITLTRELLPYESTRATGYIGAKVIGSAIVGQFLNAFYALVPWDDWHDPEYLDGLLLAPDKKPKRLLSKQASGEPPR